MTDEHLLQVIPCARAVASMKRHLHLYYLLAISAVAMALGGCASIVTPAPRVIAIVVPAPMPAAILPPAPGGLVVRPLFTDIAWPSGRRPEITAPPSNRRDGASCLQSDDTRGSCPTMSI